MIKTQIKSVSNLRRRISFFTSLIFIGFNVNAQTDIAVNQTGVLSAIPSSNITYILTVSNIGSSNASNVTLKYPAVSNFSATNIICAAGAGTGAHSVCPSSVTVAGIQGTGLIIPILPSGSSVTFTVSGTTSATVGTSITKTATVEYSADSNTANNTSSVKTEIIALPCSTTTYKIDVAATLALSGNNVGINGGSTNLVYIISSGVPIPGIGNSFTVPVDYSGLINQYGVDNRWQALANGTSTSLGRSGVMLVPRTDGVGSLYNNLPLNNSTSESNLSPSNADNIFTTKIADGNLNPLGRFTIKFGNYPSAPAGSKIISQQYTNWSTGNLRPVTSGWWLKAIANTQIFQNSGSGTIPIEMQPEQVYTFRYSAFGDGSATNSYPGDARGVILGDSQNYVTYGYDDTPLVSSITPADQSVGLGVTPSAITVSATKFNTNTTPTYQWYRNTINSNSGGTLIAGATFASYTPPALTEATTIYYYVVVKGNGTCSVSSTPARVSAGVCYKPGVVSGVALDTKVGITALGRAGADDSDNWPMVRKGGWIALESKNQGLVLNRVSFTDAGGDLSAPQVPVGISPENYIEGMMVYDTTNKCVRLYTSSDGGNTFAWSCVTKQTCVDEKDLTLKCGEAVISGDTHLDPNVNFTISIPYSNGDGSAYPQQLFPSSGTTGLTAVLAAGNLSNGNGNLVLTVSGSSPNSGGGYTFDINLNSSVIFPKKRNI